MTGIRTLILLLATLPTQFALADNRPAAQAALPDKIFVSEFEKFTLAIDNFLVWCSINENGDTYTASATFNDNTVVDLFAQPVTDSSGAIGKAPTTIPAPATRIRPRR